MATITTLAKIQMKRGFETLTLDLSDGSFTLPTGQHVPCFYVEAGTVYNTTRGGYVGGQAKRSFSTERDARAFANGWFAELTGKGWKRIR